MEWRILLSCSQSAPFRQRRQTQMRLVKHLFMSQSKHTSVTAHLACSSLVYRQITTRLSTHWGALERLTQLTYLQSLDSSSGLPLFENERLPIRVDFHPMFAWTALLNYSCVNLKKMHLSTLHLCTSLDESSI